MTGTSLDGMDFALCSFQEIDGVPELSIIATHFFEYSELLKNKIRETIYNKLNLSEFSQLNYYLAHLFSDKYRQFINRYSIDENEISCISIHGQTVWHNPQPTPFLDKQISSTLQATNLSALAKLTGKTVIGDFRSGDIALGGEGAPLVCKFDYDFFRDSNENRILLNIGGISNLTYLPKDCDIDEILAFDCGPGNVLIDEIASAYFRVPYDKSGAIARSGNIDNHLMDILLKDDFIMKKPPKSTGREKYNMAFIKSALNSIQYEISRADILRTFTEFTAIAIAQNIIQSTTQNATIIVSGGGRENTFLIELLSNKLPNARFRKIEDYGISSDFKEAIAFAYLGYLNIHHKSGNVPSATGASQPTIIGTISLP